MTTRYDLLTSREDRDGKKRWTKVGVMFPQREGDGFSIKLEALPLPNEKGEVWVSAFVPRDREDDAPSQQTRAAPRQQTRDTPARQPAPIDDDIPF